MNPWQGTRKKIDMAAPSHLPQNLADGRLTHSRTIEVRGFNPSTTVDTFDSFFENKHRTGGGEIEKIDADDKEKGIIRVTFVKPGIAENVLCRSDLKLDGAILELSPLRISDQLVWDRKAIIVHGLHPSTTFDAIELFFESKRMSGGDSVKNIYKDTDNNVAIVTFEDPGVADRVLQMRTLVLNGATLTVLPKEHVSLKQSRTYTVDYERKQPTGERVGISCASLETSADFFEDEEEDSSGSSSENNDGTSSELESQLDCQHHKEHKQSGGTQPALSILRIQGFSRTTSREEVEMFIENKSGEMDLDSCEYDEEAGMAEVIFKNSKGAAKLMSWQKLELGDAALSITSLQSVYDGLDGETTRPRAVRVCGIAGDPSEIFLSMFFENCRKSGGGEIDDLQYDNDKGIAVITFSDPDSARRVVEKQPLKVNNAEVQVTMMTPKLAVPLVLGPLEESTVLVTGLTAACTSDDLKTFFSKINVHKDIQDITFGQQPGVAMLKFTKPPDFDSLRVLCVTRPLHDDMICVHRVPLPRVVQVHNIGSISEDMLELYFDSRKRSGGGKVVQVSVHRDDDYALVKVEEPGIVNGILARGSHQLEDHFLHVSVYYDGLGPARPCHRTPISLDTTPETVVVSGCNPDIMSFVHRSSAFCRIIDVKMADVATEVGWDRYSTGCQSVELTCMTNMWKTIPHDLKKDWKQTAEDTFVDVLSTHFTADDVLVPEKIWTLFVKRTRYVEHLDHKRIVVIIKEQERRISVVGLSHEVQNIVRSLKGDLTKLQPGMSQMFHTATETVQNVKEHDLRMLNAISFKGKWQNKCPGLVVVIDYRACSICFTGPFESIATAKADMFATLKRMTSTQLDMSAALMRILTGPNLRKYVINGFIAKNTQAVFHAIGHYKLGVWAFSKENLTIAVEVIKSCISVKEVVVDLTAVKSNTTWRDLLDKIQSYYQGWLQVTETERAIHVIGAVTPVEQSVKSICDFLSQHIITEKHVNLNPGAANYMAKYMKKEISDIRDDSFNISWRTDGMFGFTVKGTQAGVDWATHRLNALAGCIKVRQCKIDKPGAPVFLSGKAGKRALGCLQAEHKVVIEPIETDHSEGVAEKVNDSTVLSTAILPYGVTVEVVQGNLTQFRADAIVNTANGQLDHVAGLAKAIVMAGGLEIQKQCRAYVQIHGKLEPGQVFVSTAGKLPCKHLMHAVCPVWKGGECNENVVLGSTITAILMMAEKHGLSSIAFPALSSGAFGFPADKCTLTIITALKMFLGRNTCVKKISLLESSKAVVKSFQRSLEMAFGSYVRKTSDDNAANANTVQNEDSVKLSVSPVNADISACIVLETPEGITLSLCKGEMTTVQVDVIVNSTNCGLHLDTGGMSSALVKIAGPQMQTQCQTFAPDGIEYGEVVTTSGGQLNCQQVVHGACCDWDGGAGRSEQVLRCLLANSFKAAHTHHYKSIAVPAVGTGAHGFPPEVVAQVMLDEVKKFSSKNSNTQLKDVRFMVYPKNIPTIQAFERTLHSSGLRQCTTPGVQQYRQARSDKATATTSSKETKRTRSRKRSVSRRRGSVVQMGQKQQFIIFNITGQSKASIGRAATALKQLCDKECAEVVLSSECDKLAITKPTDAQVQWSYEEMGVFKHYPPSISTQLEIAFQDGKGRFQWKESTGHIYCVTFDKMIETSNNSSSSVKVERCFIGASSDLPIHWSKVDSSEPFNLVVLSPTNIEYADVKKQLISSANGRVRDVIMIERVQNPGLYRKYTLLKEEMKKRRQRPAVIERSLWHGTGAEAMRNINTDGFNCRKNADTYGKGAYFAVNSDTYATPDGIAVKRLYLSRVLTGDYTTGRPSYHVPPDNPSTPGLKYDTVVDKVTDPSIFVVFFDYQAYPEYLITFR